MSDRETLAALVARCEAATEADRQLDADISVTIYGGEIVWKQSVTGEAWPHRRYASKAHIGGFGRAPVEPVTASLDAAVTLVPEGWRWEVHWQSESRSAALVQPFGQVHWATLRQASADTPALALCAAALRARMEEMSDA